MRRGLPAQTNFSATRLRQARLTRGLSRQDLAVLVGSNQSSVQQWEAGWRADTGRRTYPTFAKAQALADALGVPLEDLLDG